ncbi:hypothetical protein PTI98_002606 [Pleurotus ostreatus]|nr:hypothetical protein PTI98_002606 [Pleurotus ostreatus]
MQYKCSGYSETPFNPGGSSEADAFYKKYMVIERFALMRLYPDFQVSRLKATLLETLSVLEPV